VSKHKLQFSVSSL